MKLANSTMQQYVLKEEQALPEKEQTVFHIQAMTALERAGFLDSISKVKVKAKAKGPTVGPAQIGVLFTQRCIRNITNLTDGNGKKVKYSKSPKGNYVSDAIYNRIPQDAANELATVIAALGGMTSTAKKQ